MASINSGKLRQGPQRQVESKGSELKMTPLGEKE